MFVLAEVGVKEGAGIVGIGALVLWLWQNKETILGFFKGSKSQASESTEVESMTIHNAVDHYNGLRAWAEKVDCAKQKKLLNELASCLIPTESKDEAQE